MSPSIVPCRCLKCARWSQEGYEIQRESLRISGTRQIGGAGGGGRLFFAELVHFRFPRRSFFFGSFRFQRNGLSGCSTVVFGVQQTGLHFLHDLADVHDYSFCVAYRQCERAGATPASASRSTRRRAGRVQLTKACGAVVSIILERSSR